MPRSLAILLACTVFAAAPARAEGLDAAGARHLLDRAGYGPAPGELARLRQMGAETWLRAQLQPGAEPAALAQRLAGLETPRLSPRSLREDFFKPMKVAKQAKDQKAQREARAKRRDPVEDAQAARLWRAAGSPWQLREAMVEHWADHFNVFVGKGPVQVWVGSFEEAALRPHALGRFRDLLGAVATHPAMLFYLDNWRNSGPGGRGKRFAGLNENYARELLELHTLGVDGGYGQADVVALAQVLTGWGFPPNQPKRAAQVDPLGSGFWFDAGRHATGPKRLLGATISSGGRAEGEAALDLLAKHPATARHLARKLAARFVADEPPQALVQRLAARYLATDGRIDQVLEALFLSPEFAAARQAKLKTPYRLVVSAARALGDDLHDPTPAVRALKRLGQPLFGCPTPDGWPVRQAAWLGPDAMTSRVSLAVQLARRAEVAPAADQLGETLGGVWGAASRAAIAAAPPRLRPALQLGAPEFQRH